MSREIKFRAWDEYRKSMGQVDFMNNVGAETWEVDYEGNPGEPKTGLIIEQFTGLKDKNGVEIYEGDILLVEDGDYEITKCDTGIGAVEFLVEHGLWYVEGQLQNGLFDLHRENYLSVVGNIHQHQELLK